MLLFPGNQTLVIALVGTKSDLSSHGEVEAEVLEQNFPVISLSVLV